MVEKDLKVNLDDHLNDILKQYNFDFKHDYRPYFLKKMIWYLENEISNDKVAIWGGGGHTKYLLSYLKEIPTNIVSIIDNNQDKHGQTLSGIKIKSKTSLKSDGITKIFISTEASSGEIAEQIEMEFPNCYTIINPHKEFKYVNLRISPTAYKENNVISINAMKNDYHKYKDTMHISDKEAILREIISTYLNFRDFHSAFYYINEMKNNGINISTLMEFEKKLTFFLSGIKRNIESNKSNRTIMFMIDGMRYKEVESGVLNSLERFKKKSSIYTNVFSSSIYTLACMRSMFSNQHTLDIGYSVTDSIDLDQSDFMSYLFEQNYHFIHNFTVGPISSDKHADKIKYYVDPTIASSEITQLYNTSSEYLWKLITYMYNHHSENEFYFVHLHEAHYPYMNLHMNIDYEPMFMPSVYDDPNVKKDPTKIKEQYLDGLSFLDSQFKYYIDLIGENNNYIFFSDHGGNISPDRTPGHVLTCEDDVIHVPLVIYQPNNEKRIMNNLTSMNNLNQILLAHFREDTTYNKASDFIEVQRERLANPIFTNSAITPFLKHTFPAFICLRTNELKYIVNENGEEKLHFLPNEDMNVIEDQQYMDDIVNFRSLVKSYKYFNVSFE